MGGADRGPIPNQHFTNECHLQPRREPKLWDALPALQEKEAAVAVAMDRAGAAAVKLIYRRRTLQKYRRGIRTICNSKKWGYKNNRHFRVITVKSINSADMIAEHKQCL